MLYKTLWVDSTFLELTSWSTCWFSPITFHCNCNNALCFSSCTKECFKYISIDYLQDQLKKMNCPTFDFWSSSSSCILWHSSSCCILNDFIWSSCSFLSNDSLCIFIHISLVWKTSIIKTSWGICNWPPSVHSLPETEGAAVLLCDRPEELTLYVHYPVEFLLPEYQQITNFMVIPRKKRGLIQTSYCVAFKDITFYTM